MKDLSSLLNALKLRGIESWKDDLGKIRISTPLTEIVISRVDEVYHIIHTTEKFGGGLEINHTLVSRIPSVIDIIETQIK